MKRTEAIMAELKARGFRRSKARLALLELFEAAHSPLSVPLIELSLKKTGVRFNKTTVYREIEFLQKSGYLRELTLRNDCALYELSGSHHHHIVCVDCGDVRDVELQESLEAEEKRLARTEGFRILDHSLEFFGLCTKCQSL